jgi:hypothetical protein
LGDALDLQVARGEAPTPPQDSPLGAAAAPLDLVVGDPQILRLLSVTAMDRLFQVHAPRTAALDSLRGEAGEFCSVAGETLHTGEICA